MVNNYMHYGIEVIRQVVDSSFKNILRKAGQEYIELAIAPELDVIKYNKDGVTKYALTHPMYLPDDYAEVVYITTQTPDDCNWMLLSEDIERQHQGKAPAQRKTRAKMLLDAAEKDAYEALDSMDDDNIFSKGPVEEEELIQIMINSLASYGVTPEEIIQMEHYDVDENMLIKLRGGKNGKS